MHLKILINILFVGEYSQYFLEEDLPVASDSQTEKWTENIVSAFYNLVTKKLCKQIKYEAVSFILYLNSVIYSYCITFILLAIYILFYGFDFFLMLT